MKSGLDIECHDPIVIARGPEDVAVDKWGPWQFPYLKKNENTGEIFCYFNVTEDSAADYGLPPGVFVSRDSGETWQASHESELPGIELENGDRIRRYETCPLKVEDVTLPSKPLAQRLLYDVPISYYRAEDISEVNEWKLWRQEKGSRTWREEVVRVDIPGLILHEIQGVVPRPFFWDIRRLSDGNLYTLQYRVRNGNDFRFAAQVLKANQDATHWTMISEVACSEKLAQQFKLAEHNAYGFTEPIMDIAPDGTFFMILRTTGSAVPTPSFICYSNDEGKTWSEPELFDDLGVWPRTAVLRNGVTAVTYGRPGVFLKYSQRPDCRQWSEPYTLLTPGKVHMDTCSYTDMLPLGDDSVLVVYSDFQNYKSDNGKPVKAILARKIVFRNAE